MSKALVQFIVFILANVLCTNVSFADSYSISIQADKPRLAKVSAFIEPDGDVISMNEQNVHGLKNGWGGFIKNLEAIDSRGKRLSLVQFANSKWKLDGYTSGVVKLSYDAVLGHDTVIPKIKFGDNGAAYATDDGVMWAGRALFIAGKPSSDVSVRFHIPDNWHATTQWIESEKNRNTFKTDGTDDLQNSAFFVGTHSHSKLAAGSVTLNMAFSGKYTLKIKEDIAEKVALFFNYYGEQYHSPLESRMVLIVSDRNDGGGEVMGKAISISIGPDTQKKLADNALMPMGVSRLIAHELFHGFAFNQLEVDDKGDNAYQFEWFNEGFGAEYSSQVALLRTGLKNESEFLAGIVYRMKEYESEADGKLTLISAGADKSDKSTTVYWGGLIAAMTLDLQIQNDTNGEKNLDDLWEYLLNNYPKGGKPLTLEALYNASRKLFGSSAALALKNFAGNPVVVPFYEATALMGLSFDGEKLYPNKNATQQQKNIWKKYLTTN